MDPPGQPLSRWLCRRFWEFPPFSALVETISLAIHLQDMDMMDETVQQRPGQAPVTPSAAIATQWKMAALRPYWRGHAEALVEA